jgi:hypothetical protein
MLRRGTACRVAAPAHAIMHAAELALEVAVITLASVLGLAALGALAWLALRTRPRRARKIIAVSSF